MQKIDFDEAVDNIVQADPRYAVGAYAFLRDALDYTLRQSQTDGRIEDRHVSGRQLAHGIRDYALDQFGPMVMTVFEEWGLRSCDDFGEIVFNLIEARVFGKTEDDRKEDFSGHFDFHDAFVTPFLPAAPRREKTQTGQSGQHARANQSKIDKE